MAESTVPLQSQRHNPLPVAAPRRTRTKSAIQISSSEDASYRRSSQGNTKPESDAFQGVLAYDKLTGRAINRFTESTTGRDGRTHVFPVGVAVDVDGYIYISQRNSHCVSIH